MFTRRLKHWQFTTSDLSMSDVCYSINCSSSSNIGEAAIVM
ncbi:hypothetical protein [Caldicellulosiruptor bescii]|nr:hypothetical protein [Caldicellulosiruptor bescii]